MTSLVKMPLKMEMEMDFIVEVDLTSVISLKTLVDLEVMMMISIGDTETHLSFHLEEMDLMISSMTMMMMMILLGTLVLVILFLDQEITCGMSIGRMTIFTGLSGMPSFISRDQEVNKDINLFGLILTLTTDQDFLSFICSQKGSEKTMSKSC